MNSAQLLVQRLSTCFKIIIWCFERKTSIERRDRERYIRRKVSRPLVHSPKACKNWSWASPKPRTRCLFQVSYTGPTQGLKHWGHPPLLSQTQKQGDELEHLGLKPMPQQNAGAKGRGLSYYDTAQALAKFKMRKMIFLLPGHSSMKRHAYTITVHSITFSIFSIQKICCNDVC